MATIVARAQVALSRFRHHVWARDRACLSGGAALANRVLRIATWTIRGVRRHRMTHQASSLTYYTVFSIVPVLVVVLWILKSVGYLTHLAPAIAAASDHHAPSGSSLLRSGTSEILGAADRSLALSGGLVGLGALLYGVVRLFRNVESAINEIADARERRPRYYRLLGYLVLLLLPAILVALLSALVAIGSGFAHFLNIPRVRILIGAATILAVSWFGLAVLYAAAARARVGFASAAVGALVAVISLTLVLWAFVRFQIGASHGSPLASGLAAGPVVLLWLFTSWYVVLCGAEIATGHQLDRMLIHGAVRWRLDAAAGLAAGLAVLLRAAHAQQSGPADPQVTMTTASLARDLRLFPHDVQPLCTRLVAAGLLSRSNGAGFELAVDPGETTVARVVAALMRDPPLDGNADQAGDAPEDRLGDWLGDFLDERGQAVLADLIATALARGRATTLRDLTEGYTPDHSPARGCQPDAPLATQP